MGDDGKQLLKAGTHRSRGYSTGNDPIRQIMSHKRISCQGNTFANVCSGQNCAKNTEGCVPAYADRLNLRAGATGWQSAVSHPPSCKVVAGRQDIAAMAYGDEVPERHATSCTDDDARVNMHMATYLQRVLDCDNRTIASIRQLSPRLIL